MAGIEIEIKSKRKVERKKRIKIVDSNHYEANGRAAESQKGLYAENRKTGNPFGLEMICTP